MAKEVTIRMTVDSSGAVTGLRTLSTEAQKTGKNLKETGKASNEAGNQIKNIAGAVDFAMKAFAALKAFDMVSDFVNQGRAIRATSATFGALTANIGGATNVLNLLREATGGAVTDMSLMQANNRFLQMGLADTAEKAAELSRMAVILGGSMGKDAAGAMEEFALLLANQSIPRLDTFGISAGRVRTRIGELQRETAGLSREQAFLQAVMEQGADSIEKLGSAAGVAMDGLSRMETAFANFTDSVKKNAADAVVYSLELFNLLAGNRDAANQFGQQVTSTPGVGILGVGDIGRYTENLPASIQLIQDQVKAEQDLAAAQEAVIKNSVTLDQLREASAFGMTAEDILSGAFDQRKQQQNYLDALGFGARTGQNVRGAIDDLKTDVQFIFDTLLWETKQRQEEAYGVLNRAAVGIINQGFNIGANIQGMMQNARDYMRGNALGEFGTAQSSMISGFDPLLAGMGIDTKNLFNVAKDIALPEFMRPETAQAIAQQFGVVEEQLQRMSELNEQGLITDDELARMQTFRDNMASVNDQAQAAARAFEQMSLTDLFGTTSGGMLGEIGDMTIQAMKAAGMSDEAIASSQRQFDIASGRETSSSLAFQEQLAPFLATLAPEEQVTAMQNLTATLQEFELAGGDLNNLSPEQIMSMTGFAGSGNAGTFEIAPGDTLGEVQQRLAAQGYNLAISDLLTATGASSARTVQPGEYGFGQGAAAMPGYDPASYVASLFAGQGAAMPGAGTFLDAGFMGASMGATGGMGGIGGTGMGDSMGMAADSTSTMDTALSSILSNTTTLVEEYLPTFTENMGALSASSQLFAGDIEKATAQSGALKDELSAITEAEHNVIINFTLKGDTATLAALNAALGGSMPVAEAMAAATQANNGRPPGVDLRA